MTRAERRREERRKKQREQLEKMGFGTYEQALDTGIKNHRTKTGCPCQNSYGLFLSSDKVQIICGSCDLEIGVLERANVQEEDNSTHGV